MRRSAGDGLVAIGAPAVGPLLDRLERAGAEECVDVLTILGRLQSADTFESIVRRTEAPDPAIRTAAIRALAGFERAESTEAVARAAASPNWTVREAAAWVIGRWHWQNRDALRVLNDAVHDPHPQVRVAAASSLRALAQDSSAVDHVGRLLHARERGDETERVVATDAINDLREVVAVVFAQPRIFSPEGSNRWAELKRQIEAAADLASYQSLARLSSHRSMAPRVQARLDAPVVAEMPQPLDDLVRISVTSPISVRPQQPCVLDVWVHAPGDYETVLDYARRDPRRHLGVAVRSKGPVPVARGTTLDVSVRVPGLGWEDEDVVYWTGMVGNASYAFEVPETAAAGDYAGHARVCAGGVQIARVSFLITVGATSGAVEDVTSRQRSVTSAFASYASEDRERVLARIQGMLRILPGLDIFLDVVSLRSGERWEERLESVLLERDVLYLFWSTAARESPWVEREWRTALRAKGLDAIMPVPLEDPATAPPPRELSSLHFNDWTLQIRPTPPAGGTPT